MLRQMTTISSIVTTTMKIEAFFYLLIALPLGGFAGKGNQTIQILSHNYRLARKHRNKFKKLKGFSKLLKKGTFKSTGGNDNTSSSKQSSSKSQDTTKQIKRSKKPRYKGEYQNTPVFIDGEYVVHTSKRSSITSDQSSSRDKYSEDVIETGIHLSKTAKSGNEGCSSDAPGEAVFSGVEGSTVRYCYLITNTADVPLCGMLLDDRISVSRFITFDVDGGSNDGCLDPGRSVMIEGPPFEMPPNGERRNAVVTASPTPGSSRVIASDSAELVTVSILLEKTVKHDDNLSCVYGSQDSLAAPVDTILVYCYKIINTGNGPICDILLSDVDIQRNSFTNERVKGDQPNGCLSEDGAVFYERHFMNPPRREEAEATVLAIPLGGDLPDLLSSSDSAEVIPLETPRPRNSISSSSSASSLSSSRLSISLSSLSSSSKSAKTPTRSPTGDPTPQPSPRPTGQPTRRTTPIPTPHPSSRPNSRPILRPTRRPTSRPTPRPTRRPTRFPTPKQTPHPFHKPSAKSSKSSKGSKSSKSSTSNSSKSSSS